MSSRTRITQEAESSCTCYVFGTEETKMLPHIRLPPYLKNAHIQYIDISCKLMLPSETVIFRHLLQKMLSLPLTWQNAYWNMAIFNLTVKRAKEGQDQNDFRLSLLIYLTLSAASSTQFPLNWYLFRSLTEKSRSCFSLNSKSSCCQIETYMIPISYLPKKKIKYEKSIMYKKSNSLVSI